MSQAMILCAGLGTRLRPLTDELPKPLVPVGDRPLLAHITARLRSQGIHQVALNTHHLPRAFDSVYEWLDVEVKVVHEPEIRGTAGGVAGARRHFSSAPVLVWNGDILADPPVGRLLEGAQPLSKFDELVSAELKVARRLVSGGTPRREIYDAVCGRP